MWYAENKERLREEVRAQGIRGSGSVLSLAAKEWKTVGDKTKWKEIARLENQRQLAEESHEDSEAAMKSPEVIELSEDEIPEVITLEDDGEGSLQEEDETQFHSDEEKPNRKPVSGGLPLLPWRT